MKEENQPPITELRFEGIGVSPGIVHGKVLLMGTTPEKVRKRSIREEHVQDQIQKLEQALILTRQQIQDIQKRIADEIGEKDASIFDAHLLVVEDSALIDQAVKEVQTSLVSIEYAYSRVAKKYITSLSRIEDEYLRERAADVEDVTRRVIRNLLGIEHRTLDTLEEPRIIVSYDLSPSDTATTDRKKVIGFATDIGSKTSHTAIMARSLNIPAIVGLRDISTRLETDQEVLLDGYKGMIIVNPTQQTLEEYGQIEVKKQVIEEKLDEIRFQEARTPDGHKVILSGNIELIDDVPLVIENGAEGIGLYRTEFLFINRDDLPNEEEQYEAYRKVAAAIKPHSVIIRTLDIGGDKFLSHLQIPQEMNPFLGWRAIRFCLARPEIFKAQLRAILRASVEGNVKIMYPMISGVQEVQQANHMLEEARQELRNEGKPFDQHMSVGVMIEVPSAAMTSERIADEVDFFSLGTNDLIQYSIAVDRVNEKIAYLYEPTHPAILRLIKMVVENGHKKGKWVGLCGEMAGDVMLTPLLIGLGLDELSTGSVVVPRIKQAICSVHFSEMQHFAHEALHCDSAAEIMRRCEEMARRLYPDLVS
ncbi:MAG: phosphoenolpyruvate--protein phosphotransferase [Verrucomicrobiae bacterium]|nr:phosphoenolpyruvate--protein phosphotransferase [Verrucomicrobiae bacterium]